MFKLGQTIKRGGENYTVYKIQEFKIYAENSLGNIICIQRPSYLKIVL